MTGDGPELETVSGLDHIRALLREMDLRYQQRFDAQSRALEAALLAAEKAVGTALTAAEKAVNKAESAAEKRFECVASDVPILCADLVWRPAGDLLPGDELIAFDEEAPDRRGRRYRKAIVTANSLERDALLVVTTPLGSVRCNYQHPWLARRSDGNITWRWVNAEDLQAGDIVMHPVDTWHTDRSWESGWLAGMYDGEGCLCLNKNGGVQLYVTQRDSPTSELAAQAIKGRVTSMGAYLVEPGKYKHRVPFWHFIVSVRADVMKLLGSVRPPRLLVDTDPIWEGKPLGGKHRTTVVTAIDSAGTGMIARLSTSTHTYIGGGFAMHNSVNEFRQQLNDYQATLLPRQEYESTHRGLAEKIADLSSRVDKTEGSSKGGQQMWGYVAAAIGLVVAIAALLIK